MCADTNTPEISTPFAVAMIEQFNPHYDGKNPENVAYIAEIAELDAVYDIVINGAAAGDAEKAQARQTLDKHESKAAGLGIKAGVVIPKDWGTNEVLTSKEDAQGITVHATKKLVVNPGKALSLQNHRGREEEWHVESGVLTVVCDGEVDDYQTKQTAYLPKSKPHCMVNRSSEPVVVIETMKGICLEADNDRLICPNGKAMRPLRTESEIRSGIVFAQVLKDMGHPKAELFSALLTPQHQDMVAKFDFKKLGHLAI